MQSYHVLAACAGYTRNAVTSKALPLISGAPDTRARHSLLNSENKITHFYTYLISNTLES